ncbi:MucR family transcriptional regulator [Methylobacterium nodulans]|uniref:Transcriptional regulator, MucR family n=1 Tax=Methylobacterium nodulans (strain LMG 21967 / CNCM I-2342 / ORS 2060) TaxID=460265 RepID=B8II85_METNO|nr:MucR family transcriptional regulator [Methylobacterium nodulans]ACL57954.1 transcriptional regulator, MucR family [Methylobacterium nodulans ORS 2060]
MPDDITITAANDTGSSDLIPVTVGIVSAFITHNQIPAGGLPAFITSVHASLTRLIKPAEPTPEPLVPPVPIKKTIKPDAIISLEDGKPYKTLRRHLAGRGLTPEQYRQKWGLPPDYPMTAANYAAQRSELAKASGLGQSRRQRAAEKRPAEDAKVTSEPKKGRGRPRKAAASE